LSQVLSPLNVSAAYVG